MDWLRWILLLIGAAIVAAIWWSGYRRARERDETLFERARRDPGDVSLEPQETAAGAEGGDTDPDELEPAPDFEIPRAATPVDVALAPDVDVDVDDRSGSATEPDAAPVAAGPASGDHQPRGNGPPADAPRPARPARPEPAGAGVTADEERIESVFVVAAGGERLVGSRLQALFARHGLQHGEMGIFHLHDAEGHIQFSVANLVEPGTFDPATMDTLSTPGVALFLRLPGPPSAEIALDRMIRIARSMADELDARVLDQQQSTLTRQTEQHLRDQMRAWDHQHRRGRA